MSSRRDQTRDLTRFVAVPLRYGGVVSVVVIGIGLLLDLGHQPEVRNPHPEPFTDMIAGGDSAVIAIGLLLLALVPIAMIIGALIGFVRSGERRYQSASLLVTILLVASLLVPALILR